MVEGGERGREAREGLADIGVPLVADGQAAEAVEPGMGTLDHPSVAAKFLAALDTTTDDARHDPARPTFVQAGSCIVGLLACSLSGRRRGRPRRNYPPL